MASDNVKKSKKGKKKAKKDKWGQPVISDGAMEQGEAEEEFGAAEEEQRQRQQEDDDEKGSCNLGIGYEPNKVVVSGMPYSTTEDEIRDLFKDTGPIHQLQLSRFPDTGNFRGLAFLTFQTEEAAANSLNLDGTKMGNRFVKVERCRGDPQRKRKSESMPEPKKVEGCFSAYIGNLSWDVTEDDIRSCFEESKIVSVRFAVDKRTGAFRGFGHIDFEDDESLEEAVKKNQVELHGRPMRIAYAVSRD